MALFPIAIVIWGVGAFALIGIWAGHDEIRILPGNTSQARAAVAFAIWMFAPLVLVALVVVAIGAGICYIAIGFRDLYQQFAPRRTKLPVAKVRK